MKKPVVVNITRDEEKRLAEAYRKAVNPDTGEFEVDVFRLQLHEKIPGVAWDRLLRMWTMVSFVVRDDVMSVPWITSGVYRIEKVPR